MNEPSITASQNRGACPTCTSSLGGYCPMWNTAMREPDCPLYERRPDQPTPEDTCPTCGWPKSVDRYTLTDERVFVTECPSCGLLSPQLVSDEGTNAFVPPIRTNDPQSCERIATPTSPDHATTGEAE